VTNIGSALQPEPNEGSRCAFCKYWGKLTGEHIWPQGLLNALGFPSDAKATVTRGGGPALEARTAWTASAFDGEVRIDCDICNNKRLEVIEKAARPYVAAMAAGESGGPLEPAAQRAVAAFALRMFAVAQYTHPSNRPVPRHHREFLVEHGEPPQEARVWLWRYEGANPMSSPIYILPVQVRWPGDQGAERENAYRGILRVGHLVMEIAASTDERPFPVTPVNRDAHLRIWPPHEPCETVDWPPLLVMNEVGLQQRIDSLTRTFTVPVHRPPGR
jgi:hypothetical protein